MVVRNIGFRKNVIGECRTDAELRRTNAEEWVAFFVQELVVCGEEIRSMNATFALSVFDPITTRDALIRCYKNLTPDKRREDMKKRFALAQGLARKLSQKTLTCAGEDAVGQASVCGHFAQALQKVKTAHDQNGDRFFNFPKRPT